MSAATRRDTIEIFAAASVIPIALFLIFQRMFLQGGDLSGAIKG